MSQTVSITFRMSLAARDYLHERAKRFDRSMNGEISAILRELKDKEKAPGHVAKQSPDASAEKENGHDAA